MDHRHLTTLERNRLHTALRGNADSGLALLMGRDTGFVGTMDEVEDFAETIDAVKAIPSHY